MCVQCSAVQCSAVQCFQACLVADCISACKWHACWPCVQAALIEAGVPWNTTADDLQAAFQAAYGRRQVSIVCDKK